MVSPHVPCFKCPTSTSFLGVEEFSVISLLPFVSYYSSRVSRVSSAFWTRFFSLKGFIDSFLFEDRKILLSPPPLFFLRMFFSFPIFCSPLSTSLPDKSPETFPICPSCQIRLPSLRLLQTSLIAEVVLCLRHLLCFPPPPSPLAFPAFSLPPTGAPFLHNHS